MQAIVMVSQLMTDDGKFRRGEMVDYPEDRIAALGSSVKAVVGEKVKDVVDEVVVAEAADHVSHSDDAKEEVVIKPKRGRPAKK